MIADAKRELDEVCGLALNLTKNQLTND